MTSSARRRVASNTAVQLAGKGVVLAIGLVSIAVLTRYLGPSDYGKYTLALMYMQLFAVLADIGLLTTVVREIPNRSAICFFGTPCAARLRINAQSSTVITLQSSAECSLFERRHCLVSTAVDNRLKASIRPVRLRASLPCAPDGHHIHLRWGVLGWSGPEWRTSVAHGQRGRGLRRMSAFVPGGRCPA